MSTGTNPLAVLGVGPEADPREIRDAYLAVVKSTHESDPTGEEFRRVQWAYVTLTADAHSRPSPAAVAAAPPGYRAAPGEARGLPYAMPSPEVVVRRQRRATLRRWAKGVSVTVLASAAILGSGYGMYLLAAP